MICHYWEENMYKLNDKLVKNALLQEIEPDSITNANANTLKVYNLKFDKISSAKCNMFLVSVLNDQKSIPGNPYYQHYDYYLMDCYLMDYLQNQ